MSILNFILRTTFRIILILFCLIIFIRACYIPQPSRNELTRIHMRIINAYFNGYVNKSACTNIIEYVKHTTGTEKIPQILEHETIRKLLDDAGMPLDVIGDNFFDAWKQPIIITFTTNNTETLGLSMHSFGKNKRDENGAGDDIIMWFSIELMDSQ